MNASLSAICQPLVAIATTPQSARHLSRLCGSLGLTLWVPETLAALKADYPIQIYHGSLKDHIAELWPNQGGFVLGLALGAVVRLIAPHLKHKSVDPAVVVVDETGETVISVCSGHLGGADVLAQEVAIALNARPIITGATAAAQLPSLDCLGHLFNWQRGAGDWNRVSAMLAQQKPVGVYQEAGSDLWRHRLPEAHPYQIGVEAAAATVKITAYAPQTQTEHPQVYWHPQVLWLGIGCERDTPAVLISAAVDAVLQQYQLAPAAIAGVASLDLKADEPGLLAFCAAQQLPLHCFNAETLKDCPVPNPSTVVAQAVGTPSVAEAAALTAAAQVAIALQPDAPSLIAPKQIFRQDGIAGAVTVAVAQASHEWIGTQGQLWLVGTGPGDLEHMTPAAQRAICRADVVIGYTLYLELVQSLFRPEQLIERSPITQERQRAQRAIALANWGLTVAVVSSGDAGIYGMAGLVMEELQAQQWDGRSPQIRILPGVSALQSAASRVGTPLMHDFCAISLSDHLTPWIVIETRLEAAATADLVTALYNPRSQVRVGQILEAQQIFLRHRDAQTPVAIVRAAYRTAEEICLTTLGELHQAPVDMLSTVLIGNSSTRFYEQWMITPRGYLGFAVPSAPAAL